MKFTCTQCGKQRSAAFVLYHMAAHAKLVQMPHTYVEKVNEPRPYDPDNFDGYEDYRLYAAAESYPYCGVCGNDPSSNLHTRLVIEYPCEGRTYFRTEYGVYEYGFFSAHSVNSGQQSRSFLDSFETLEEAQNAYPSAIWDGGTSERADVVIPDTAPAWFDPTAIGESWDGE